MAEVIVSGIAQGAAYGLIALGMSIMLYVTRVINFAQGQVAMVAVMITAAAANVMPIGVAIVAGLAAGVLTGVLTFLIAVRPVILYDRFSFAWLASTLGVGLILENAAASIWGTSTGPFPALLNDITVRMDGVTVTVEQILTVAVALIATMVFEAIRRRTLVGRVGMAVAFDPDIAASFGANTLVYSVSAFALAALLASAAGVLVGPVVFANPFLGSTYGISGFVALMLAGTRHPAAAVFGGMLLGILNEAANAVINPQASTWFPFVVVVVVLLFVPQGLFSGVNYRHLLMSVRRLAVPKAVR